MSSGKSPDGTLRPYGEPGSRGPTLPLRRACPHPASDQSPRTATGNIPGLEFGGGRHAYRTGPHGDGDPDFVQGRSLAPGMRDGSTPASTRGRDFVVSSIPFANPGDPVHSVDNLLRPLSDYPVTTVTSGDWSLLYSPEDGVSELTNLLRSESDPERDRYPQRHCRGDSSAPGPVMRRPTCRTAC